MKKLLIILITIPLLFNSCKKEDDTTDYYLPNPSGSILGTWKIENYSYQYIEGYVVFGTETIIHEQNFNGPSNGVEEYLTFRDDSTLLNHMYENDILLSTDTLNYTELGNSIYTDSEFYRYNGIVLHYVYDHLLIFYDTLSYITRHSNNTWEWEVNDTTYFGKLSGSGNMLKSNLPFKTIQSQNKTNPVNIYNRFFDRRINR